ncbi:MAG TPA: hypothetical protein VIN06_14230 [Devosia sp.]
MARRVPAAQLALFEELPKAPPPMPEAILALAGGGEAEPEVAAPVELFSPEVIGALEARPVAPERPPVPDRLAIVVPVSSRSGSSIGAAARQVEISDAVLFSLRVSLLDLGPVDRFDAEDVEAIVRACAKIEMGRFDAVFRALGPRFDSGPALFPDEDGELAALLDCLRGALRACGAPDGADDDNGPHLPLGSGPQLTGHTSLDRPLKLPVRDFALVRVFGDGGYEVQRKWSLMP